MDKRISGLVVLGFSVLLLLGLGTNVFLQQSLKHRGDEARSLSRLFTNVRASVRDAKSDYLLMGREVAGMLLDPTPGLHLEEALGRKKKADAASQVSVGKAIAATKSVELRTVLRQLQKHDDEVTDPMEDRIMQMASIDNDQAQALYRDEYVNAQQVNLDLLERSLQLARNEVQALQDASDAETTRAQQLALATIALFLVIGILAAWLLARAVSKLVRESNATAEQNRDLIENSLDVICSIDAAGCFSRVSGACLRVWGYTADELLGRAYITLVHPDDVEKTNSIAAEILAGKSARAFTNRYVHKDGGVVYTMWSARWIAEQQQIFAVAHDVTDRELATQALQASEERTRLIVATAHDAFISMDIRGTVTDWNPQAEAAFGWSREEAIGKPLHELIIPPQYRESYVRRLRNFQATGEGPFLDTLIEMQVIHRDGHALPVEFTVSGIRHGDEFTYSVFLRDITERKRAKQQLHEAVEAAEAGSRAKSDFLANMSHEIRTPMNGVLGTVDLLLSTKLNGTQRELASLARASGETLLTIINDILDFAKIEAGKLLIEPLPFDLLLAVEEVSGMIAMQADLKNLDVVVRYPADVPRHLIGDPGRIRQILVNLVNNAIKFTQQGQVLINVEAQERSDAQVVLRFEVEDSGIGIAEDRLGHLFEKFTQADTTTTRRFGGTGLGLAICRELVELMGGQIGARSQEGKGSTFWFTLPLPLQKEAPPILPPVELAGTRTLIVDDNAVNRRVLDEQVAAWKMRNGSCSSAAEALVELRAAYAAGDPYQIAILDYQMPDMDGAMLGAAIKADPTLKDTVLVMLTSLGRRGDGSLLKEIGFAAYLVKPARQSELLGALSGVWAAHIHHQPMDLFTVHTLREARSAPPVEEVQNLQFDTRVLVAEDNTTNQIVASMMLRALGCRVDVAANGQEALARLEACAYDVVFMDCEMPVMDGFEATAAIRNREDAKARVPIVAVTAQAMQGDRERCLRAGMNGYISKPVKLEDFSAELRRWVPERMQQDVSDDQRTAKAKHPSNSPAPAAAAVDPATFSRLRELSQATDPNLLKQIYEAFHSDSIERISTLRMAVDAEDHASLHKAAHALKGAAANVGAKPMSNTASKLEALGAAGSLADATELINRLQEEFANVVAEMRVLGVHIDARTNGDSS
ncbi:MAG: PAS domain S-box protein [Lysobacteraceae bacterium]